MTTPPEKMTLPDVRQELTDLEALRIKAERQTPYHPGDEEERTALLLSIATRSSELKVREREIEGHRGKGQG